MRSRPAKSAGSLSKSPRIRHRDRSENLPNRYVRTERIALFRSHSHPQTRCRESFSRRVQSSLSTHEELPMNVIETLPAPDVSPPAMSDERWQHERSAFLKLLPSLLTTSAGGFVAIHNAQVVAIGDDKISVARQAYALCGYVPIYVGHVVEEPPSLVRIPTPRSAVRL